MLSEGEHEVALHEGQVVGDVAGRGRQELARELEALVVPLQRLDQSVNRKERLGESGSAEWYNCIIRKDTMLIGTEKLRLSYARFVSVFGTGPNRGWLSDRGLPSELVNGIGPARSLFTLAGIAAGARPIVA